MEVPIRVVFDSPTVGKLAQQLDTQAEVRDAVRSVDRSGPVALSFAQQRLWFVHQLEGPSPTYNIAFALRMTGVLNHWALRDALNDVALRHEALRTIFVSDEGVPTQHVVDSALASVPVEVVGVEDHSLEDLVQAAALYEFDLSREIPLRARLIELTDSNAVLTIVLHHIAGDGWSLVPLLRDLGIAYRARV
ncbi:hypothetical protein HCA61_25865, partial [Rhodococcus sp. HNM0563]|uniref:condensation domain-containing protein n=1 Tax=Rhodococcus sp. HNM0563 TaxID=2716339 RepID=UPI00146C8DB6|nr:hypothetical protein [Rhodococcus sp. HNM0563]